MQTLLLDVALWDLVVDVDGDIAVSSNPYSQAQDAASAIKTFEGEVYYDTTLGVPFLQSILGRFPPLSLIRQQFIAAALTVPGVEAAQVFISSFKGRKVTGQVQIEDPAGNIGVAGF